MEQYYINEANKINKFVEQQLDLAKRAKTEEEKNEYLETAKYYNELAFKFVARAINYLNKK